MTGPADKAAQRARHMMENGYERQYALDCSAESEGVEAITVSAILNGRTVAQEIALIAGDLSPRQANAVRLATETHGVSSHGNVVKALAKRGLADGQHRPRAVGGGTQVRLTNLGRQVGEFLIEERRR